MVHSTIDRALAALYNLLSTRLAVIDPDVDVKDGPSVDDVGQNVVAVGLTAESSSTDSTQRIAGLYVQHETYDIECLVRSWTGDHDLTARRGRAFQIFEECVSIINEHPDLDGAVTRARLARVDYHAARIPEGAVASVTFRVRIETLTS